MPILSNFQGPRTILRRGRLIYECFSNAFLLKKTSKFRVFTKKHDWICYFLPKYAWENCSWAFSCLDQNSNLNLSPAGWPGKFFFSPFPRKWLETISRNDLKWCIMAFPEKTFRKDAHNIRKYAKKSLGWLRQEFMGHPSDHRERTAQDSYWKPLFSEFG